MFLLGPDPWHPLPLPTRVSWPRPSKCLPGGSIFFCLSGLMLDQAPSHITLDPRAWTGPLGRAALDPRFALKWNTFACVRLRFTMTCGADIAHYHFCKYIRVWAHPLSPDPSSDRMEFGRIFLYCRMSVARHVWRKTGLGQILAPKLRIALACPQLSVETYPHARNNERAKHERKSKRLEGPNLGINRQRQ